MNSIYNIKQILNAIKGDTPMTVVVWYSMLSSVVLLSIAGILFWYYSFYSIVSGSEASSAQRQLYKSMINKKHLEEIVQVYDEK